MRSPHQFRNFAKQPAKLGLVVPAGASISTDSDELAAQLELEGGRQGVRAEGSSSTAAAASDGGDADAAESATKRKRSTRKPAAGE